MFAFRDSPPPLSLSCSTHSDRSRSESRELSPATPTNSGLSPIRRFATHWQQKATEPAKPTTSVCLVPISTSPAFDEADYPLFEPSPTQRMATSGLLDSAVRHKSASPPGNQPSGITAALKKQEAVAPSASRPPMEPPRPAFLPQDSSETVRFENGTRPITMKSRPMLSNNRRESIAQSMNMGMSWGGISVGSWVRDDMMMAGTSPFAFHQSPSYHSSSYLPKLEANFMKDFVCCGMTLPTLHDLLQHYEEAHAQKEPQQADATAQPPMPDQRAAIATNTAAQIQHEAQKRVQSEQANGGAVQPPVRPAFTSSLQAIPDMDTVEDMEMDDIDDSNETTPPSNMFANISNHNSPQPTISQPQIPQLNTSMMQSHQAYRHSTPTTPITGRNAVALQGANISSTLNANPMQHFQDLHGNYRETPDSSAPGTPGEFDEDFLSNMDDLTLQNFNNINGFNTNFGFGGNNDMIDLCIDEPAKRLFQTTTPNNSQSAIHARLGSGVVYGPNSELAKRIREQQIAAGLPDTNSNLLPHEEPKPYRCPVIGCEKAYKNQNGLKYHKTHGHQNQRLHENGDGTYSIVDPDNNAPFPGTMGMEKEKPYKCDVCQKRYKNLNGLKYHKTHSEHCNPELAAQKQQERAEAMARQRGLQGQQTPTLKSPLQHSTTHSSISNMLPAGNMNSLGFGGLNDDVTMS